MRILRICSCFEAPVESLGAQAAHLDPVGGMQVHTADLSRALDERGVAQTVLTATRARAPRLARIGSRSVVVRLGVETKRLRQMYALPAARLAVTRVQRHDLIHAHLGEDIAVLPIACAAARRGRVPVVVTVHSSPGHTVPVVDLRTAAIRVVGGVLERVLLGRADAVFVLTRQLRQTLIANGVPADRVVVVPPRINRERFTRSYPDDPFPDLSRPRVVFVGRLAAQKGVRTLLSAAPAIDAEILLVGDGPERDWLERHSPDRVHFVGFVPHERIPAVLANADVLALPSRYEELGAVLIEALWSGLPVVASRVGGIPEVVRHGETGLLVPPDDPRALADAVNRILTDETLRRRLRAGAVADWGRWDGLVERTLTTYEALTRRPPRIGRPSSGTG